MTPATIAMIDLFEKWQLESLRQLKRADSIGYRLHEAANHCEREVTDAYRAELRAYIAELPEAIAILKGEVGTAT